MSSSQTADAARMTRTCLLWSVSPPQGLCRLLWALAAMDYVPERLWLRAVAGQVRARGGGVRVCGLHARARGRRRRHLPLCRRCLLRTVHRLLPLWLSLFPPTHAHMAMVTPLRCADLTHTPARLRHARCAHPQLQARARDFTPDQVVTLHCALARLGCGRGRGRGWGGAERHGGRGVRSKRPGRGPGL